jgi:hypothetical protein
MPARVRRVVDLDGARTATQRAPSLLGISCATESNLYWRLQANSIVVEQAVGWRFREELNPARSSPICTGAFPVCLQHFGICNPGQPGKMFGRLILYANGLPIGFVRIDSQRVTDAYEVLLYAYEECKDRPGEFIRTSEGTFKLVTSDEIEGADS